MAVTVKNIFPTTIVYVKTCPYKSLKMFEGFPRFTPP
jgi:hypothetical protein